MLKIIPKRNQMVQIILNTVSPVKTTEVIPFYEACDRVLAESVYSQNTLPNTKVSRLDGIAVHFCDFASAVPDSKSWHYGQEYCYCNTGIALPAGFDTVIPIEEVQHDGDGILLGRIPQQAGELVVPPGDAMQEGECIAHQGNELTPAQIGLLAAAGILNVSVYCRPRIAVIPTGDELVSPCRHPATGKNIESNSYMIAAYLRRWGAEPLCYPIITDNPSVLRRTLEQATTDCDAIIIIAGSSLGSKDYTAQVIKELGSIIVPELAHGPGRKSSLAIIAGKPVLGIAGPPLGAQITCDLYLSVFVSALRGLPPSPLPTIEAICDDIFTTYPVDFCERVHLYQGDDGIHFRSLFSHHTTRAQMETLANGNFYRKQDSSCQPGDRTLIECLCPLSRLPQADFFAYILSKEKEL